MCVWWWNNQEVVYWLNGLIFSHSCAYYCLYSYTVLKRNLHQNKSRIFDLIHIYWHIYNNEICLLPNLPKNKLSGVIPHVRICSFRSFVDFLLVAFFHGCISGCSEQVVAQSEWKSWDSYQMCKTGTMFFYYFLKHWADLFKNFATSGSASPDRTIGATL